MEFRVYSNRDIISHNGCGGPFCLRRGRGDAILLVNAKERDGICQSNDVVKRSNINVAPFKRNET